MTLKGPFVMDAIYDMGEDMGSAALLGEGNLTLSIKDAFFRFSAFGRAIGKLELESLEVDLGFSGVTWSFDGLTFDGAPNDLSSLARLVKTVFDLVWREPTKTSLVEGVRCAINHTVHVSD